MKLFERPNIQIWHPTKVDKVSNWFGCTTRLFVVSGQPDSHQRTQPVVQHVLAVDIEHELDGDGLKGSFQCKKMMTTSEKWL